MKLVWSPETASKAYIETVKSCEKFKESGVAELLSAMAAGWNAKLIVEAWSEGGSMATSIGLAVAARNTGGRHVCLVPDERSREKYAAAMKSSAAAAEEEEMTEIAVGEVEAAMEALAGVDFLVVDCKRRDLGRVLRSVKVCHNGAVFACKNAWMHRNVSSFRWQCALQRGTRVVRSVFLPVGTGLDIAHIGSKCNNNTTGASAFNRPSSRWIKHVDQRSGEEHVFRK